MALYTIPVSKMEELTKMIKRIQNKGADITFEVGNEVVQKHKLSYGPVIAIRCNEVEVSGRYQIEDWSFVGTIEHSESGNILRVADSSFEGKIPAKYRTIGQECEHCHQIRDRKDTYLVYNSKTDEFKQVGRTCLRGYTGGLDAEFCAKISDVLAYVFELEHEEDTYDYGGFMKGDNSLSTDSIKKTIFAYVKAYGYVPQETGRALAQLLFAANGHAEIEDVSDAEIAEMDAWVETIDSSSDYMWNAKTAWKKDYAEYRDVALLASFVKVFLKAKSDEAKRVQSNSEKANEYVGNVGDRITIKDIKSVRVLFTKEGDRYAYHAPDTYVQEIVDGTGHVYIWSSTNFLLQDFQYGKLKEIVATVKEHKEYKGLKQTVVTRGKVTLSDEKKPEPAPKTETSSGGVKDALKALSDILDN